MDPAKVIAAIAAALGDDLAPWERTYLEYHATRYAHTLALLGPGQGRRLLDVGSYPGHLAVAAQAQGFTVTALTGPAESGQGLEQFQARMARLGIDVLMCDVEREPFPLADGACDYVLASEIIEHLPYNPYRLLRESYRVLVPGGRVLVSTPNLNRLQAVLAMLVDQSPWPSLAGRFSESFCSVLTSRHVREYTGPEIVYMLARQNKEMYRFHQARLTYSTCLDPPFAWRRLPAWGLEQLWPRMRSNQMVVATRPLASRLIAPEEIAPAQGLHAVETHPENNRGIGMILSTPFRWSGPRLTLGLPAGEAAFQVFTLHVVDLKPEALPTGIWRVSVNGRELPSLGLRPDRAFTPLRLALPRELAQGSGHDGRFTLTLEGPTWTPAEHQGEHYWEYDQADPRALGLALGWDGVLREHCEGLAQLKALAGEMMAGHSFAPAPPRWGQAPGLDQRWAPWGGLHLARARIGAACAMGRGDWVHLGAGWQRLERLEGLPGRWSAQEAEFFLRAPRAGAPLRLRLRAGAGHPALGERVEAALAWSWSDDGLTFPPVGPAVGFTALAGPPRDHVFDLDPAPVPGALLRARLTVPAPRVPALLLGGSGDHRSLGLAVTGLALTRAEG